MHHELKIEDAYYEAVIEGIKTFEIRFNDRGYQKGDTVSFLKSSGAVERKGQWEITYVSNFN